MRAQGGLTPPISLTLTTEQVGPIGFLRVRDILYYSGVSFIDA